MESTYFVVNNQGVVAGHDLTIEQANEVLERELEQDKENSQEREIIGKGEGLKLNAFGETYTLELQEGIYANNHRKYFCLIDMESGEDFCDITSNYPDIELADNECLLKQDFICCFGGASECIEWLKENGIAKDTIRKDGVRGFTF